MAHYKYHKTVKVYVSTSQLGFSSRACTWPPYNIGNFLHDLRAKNYKRPSKERVFNTVFHSFPRGLYYIDNNLLIFHKLVNSYTDKRLSVSTYLHVV